MIQSPSGTRKIATLSGWLMVVTFVGTAVVPYSDAHPNSALATES